MTFVCQQLTLQPERRSYSQDQRQSSAAESPPPAGTQRRVWLSFTRVTGGPSSEKKVLISASTGLMLEVKVHDMTVRKETEWVWLVWTGFHRKIYQWICKELGKKSDWRHFIWKASSVLRPNSGEFKILHRMSQGVWWGTRSIVGQRPSYGTTPTRT